VTVTPFKNSSHAVHQKERQEKRNNHTLELDLIRPSPFLILGDSLMVHSNAEYLHPQHQEANKWGAVFANLGPLKTRTISILEDRYGPTIGRFLRNPGYLDFTINWDTSGASLGNHHLSDDTLSVDPNQLLREISLLEAYGINDDILSPSRF
jgi:hypothetical protein